MGTKTSQPTTRPSRPSGLKLATRETILQGFVDSGVTITAADHGGPVEVMKNFLLLLFPAEGKVIITGREKEVKMYADEKELEKVAREIFKEVMMRRMKNSWDTETAKAVDRLAVLFAGDHHGQTRGEFEQLAPFTIKIVWYFASDEWFGPIEERRLVDRCIEQLDAEK